MEEASASSTAPPAAPGPEVAPPGPPPAPSPLSGGYLLIILGEPHCAEHKDIILQRLAKGFLSWDSDVCHVDLEKELLHLAAQKPDGEESKNGERLIQFASESLVTEVLIQPQTTTLIQCARNLLSSFTRHRHIIHAGYTFAGNGSWALQDGTFSLLDFLDALREPEPQRVIRAYENNVSIDIQCSAEGEWSTTKIAKEPGTKGCIVRVNPDDKMTAGSPGITQFVEYISNFLVPAGIEELLEPSDVVGNIRFSHPTLYVFPGGQGDAALFGINGFNMLVDGGYSRKSCFWDFTRHLDRLDAVMVTRINNSNVGGIASVLKRKTLGYVYPQIGHFFCNMQERRSLPSPDGDKDRDPLLVDLLDEGHSLIANLRLLELKPHACYRDSVIEPINLYHKVGHGKLDMYVLSPAKDSKEVREFLAKWSTNDQKLFTSKTSKLDSQFPLYNITSICALLVWQPANPTDTITRILFPGSTPQHKIFEGLEKIKHLEFLKFPTCTAKSIALSSATKTKSKLFEKPAIESKPRKIMPAVEKSIPFEPKSKQLEAEKNNKNNLSSQRAERKSTSKSEDKKDSPPTPKKIADPKPKVERVKRSKSPTVPPAKSDKEANNRKVLESKIEKTKTSTIKSAPRREPPKETKTAGEKKPLPIKKAKSIPAAKPSPPVSPKKQMKPKSSPKKVLKKEVKSTAKKVEKVIKAKPASTLASEKPAVVKPDEEDGKPAHVQIEAVDDVLTATIVKETEASEEPTVDAVEGEVPSGLESQAEDVTEEDILSEKQGDADEKVSTTEGDIDTQVDDELATDDGENKHIRDEEESEKERAKKDVDTAEADENVEDVEETQDEVQGDEKLNDAIPIETVPEAGIEITDVTLTTDVPETEDAELKEDLEVVQPKDESVVEDEEKDQIDSQKPVEDNDPEEKEPEEVPSVDVKDEEEAEALSAQKHSDEVANESNLESPELCGVVDSAAVEDAAKQAETEDAEAKNNEISEETKQKIEGEVKEIITSAQSKVAEDDATKEKVVEVAEPSVPEIGGSDGKADVSSEKQKEDSPQEDKKDIKPEEGTNTKSQPDEKLSAMETSATTAPSMPEDEKIDDKIILDEIKEEKIELERIDVVEAKVSPAPTIEPLKAIQLEQTHLQHHRDLVKTPDEVADLPMHEEVDGVMFDSSEDKKHDDEKADIVTESSDIKVAENFAVEDEMKKIETLQESTESKPQDCDILQHAIDADAPATKEIIGEKEMQKSAIDEKEVDTTLEMKEEDKQGAASISPQNETEAAIKEEVDAVPTGEFHEVADIGSTEVQNRDEEKKDEEKESPATEQGTPIDVKSADDVEVVDAASTQNGLELSDFEKVIDEEYGIKSQIKSEAQVSSQETGPVKEVVSTATSGISSDCPDKESLDVEEKDKESPKSDKDHVKLGDEAQKNDLTGERSDTKDSDDISREKDEYVVDIDEKGSDVVGRRLSQSSPKQELRLSDDELVEETQNEPCNTFKSNTDEVTRKSPTIGTTSDHTNTLPKSDPQEVEAKEISRSSSPNLAEKSQSPSPNQSTPQEEAIVPKDEKPLTASNIEEKSTVAQSLDTALQSDIQQESGEGDDGTIEIDGIEPEELSRPASTESKFDTKEVNSTENDKALQGSEALRQDINESSQPEYAELDEIDSKQPSRPVSSEPAESKDLSRPESSREVGSRPQSSEPEKADTKDVTGPDSAEPEEAELKDQSRPQSVDPDVTDKKESSPVVSAEPEKSESKGSSRAESAEPAKDALKETSRPVSVEPTQSDLKVPSESESDSKGPSSPASTEPETTDLKAPSSPVLAKQVKSDVGESSRPSSAEPAKTDSKEQSQPDSAEPVRKDSSRPESTEPAKSDTNEPSRPVSAELAAADSKGPSRIESAEPEKSDSKEPSRPESTELARADEKSPSQPESADLAKSESKERVLSAEVAATDLKETSRPQSAETAKSESREPSRAASAELKITDTTVLSRPESTEPAKSDSKEQSRPPSADTRGTSRPVSAEPAKSDAKEPPKPASPELAAADSKTPSRPESTEPTKSDSKEPSRPASSELTAPDSKATSRPESTEPAKSDSKEPSRPASSELTAADLKATSKPESTEPTKSDSKEPSRPASSELTAADSKAPSRPESTEPTKLDSKEPSRPASSELTAADSKAPSRPESTEPIKSDSKEPSRPASSELTAADSKAPSRPESTEPTKSDSKEPSRPASSELTAADLKATSRPESTEPAKSDSKEPSRPASSELTAADLKATSRPESTEPAKSDSKEPSRPASSELTVADSKAPSRPESTEPTKLDSKEPSRPVSAELATSDAGNTTQLESAEPEKSDSKEPSRPASSGLTAADLNATSRPESSEPAKLDSKEPSRPVSAELPAADTKGSSRPESTEPANKDSKEPSRPASSEIAIADSKGPSRPESTEPAKLDSKEPSRPVSAELATSDAGDTTQLESTEPEKSDSKEPSRPVSAELPAADTKCPSRPESAEPVKSDSKEPSRAASTEIAAANSKGTSRPESVEPENLASKDTSRPVSAELAEIDNKESSRPESTEPAKSDSKEPSRPVSTELVVTDGKGLSRPDSTEPVKSELKEPSRPVSAERVATDAKGPSRPESTEPTKSDSKEPSRSVSTELPAADTKGPSRPESTEPAIAASTVPVKSDSKDASRAASTELVTPGTEITSRPESVEPAKSASKSSSLPGSPELNEKAESKAESSQSNTKSIPDSDTNEFIETSRDFQAPDQIASSRPASDELAVETSSEIPRPSSTETREVESSSSRPESDLAQVGSNGLATKESTIQATEITSKTPSPKDLHEALQEGKLVSSDGSPEKHLGEITDDFGAKQTYHDNLPSEIVASTEKIKDLTSLKDSLLADEKEITKSPSPEPELRDIEFFKGEKSPSPAPSLNEANALLNGKPLPGTPSPLPPVDLNEKTQLVEDVSLDSTSPAKKVIDVHSSPEGGAESPSDISQSQPKASEQSDTLDREGTEKMSILPTNISDVDSVEIKTAQQSIADQSFSKSPIQAVSESTTEAVLEKSPSPTTKIEKDSGFAKDDKEDISCPIDGQAEKSEPLRSSPSVDSSHDIKSPPAQLSLKEDEKLKSVLPPSVQEGSECDIATKSKSPSPTPSMNGDKKSSSPGPSLKDRGSKTPSPIFEKHIEFSTKQEDLYNKTLSSGIGESTNSVIHIQKSSSPTGSVESVPSDEKSKEPSKTPAAPQSAEKTPSPSEVSDPITASYIEIINKLQSDSSESVIGKPLIAQIDDPMTRSTLFEEGIDSSDVPEQEKCLLGAEIDAPKQGDEHTIKKSHHRLMLTASSEDGGGETEFDTVPCPTQEKGIKTDSQEHVDMSTTADEHERTSSSSTEKKITSTGVTADKFSIPEDIQSFDRVEKQIELDHSSIFVAANIPVKDDVESSSTKTYETNKFSSTDRAPSPGYDSDHENVPPSPHSDISSGQMSRDPHVWDDNRSSSRQSEISDKDIASPPFTSSKMKFEVSPQSVMTGSFYGGLPGEDEFTPVESVAKDVKDSKNQIAKMGEIAAATISAVAESLPQAGPSLGSSAKPEATTTSSAATLKDKDPIESWGKPLGLPSPAPPATNDTIGSQHGTPKKEKTGVSAKKSVDRSKAKSNKDASTKSKIPTSPMYFDLTYVPHHGNSNYSQVEFFKNVRARYYVFSGIEPSKEVYDALLEGKQSWDEKDLEVTIIPTYDTDTLGQWVAENEESIALNKIDLSPSASRCTINLQDHETSCSAYRLEF